MFKASALNGGLMHLKNLVLAQTVQDTFVARLAQLTPTGLQLAPPKSHMHALFM